MSYKDYWQPIKNCLRDDPTIDRRNYDLFFARTQFLFRDENNVYIRATKTLLERINTLYSTKINELATSIFGEKLNFRFKADIDKEETDIGAENDIQMSFSGMRERYVADVPSQQFNKGILKRSFTFENYIVGDGNKLAHAAAMAVANNPGKVYNPLFLYGGVGLGKTHLLCAIGNKIRDIRPAAKVMVISIEQFMSDFISAIQAGKIADFKNRYRSVDVLMIDDIQFLKGRESTQEEFHHTFNALYGSSKQIVITSDRKPVELKNLTDRIISRFQQGFIVDIQAPGYETRQAILRMKIQNEYDRYDIEEFDDAVIDYIANHFKTNIRELEGALLKVIGYSSMYDKKPNIELAKEVLKESLVDQRSELTVELIIEAIADYFKINVDDILTGDRRRNFAAPRQIAMYLARTHTNCSFPEIGDKFGGKNHATVIYAYKKIAEKIENNSDFRDTIKVLNDIFSKYVA